MTTQEWKDHVASIGCVLCLLNDWGETPASLHHVREGQGMAQRSSDWLVVPLCKEHHQGKTGIHGGHFYTRWKLDEMDLLAETIKRTIGAIERR